MVTVEKACDVSRVYHNSVEGVVGGEFLEVSKLCSNKRVKVRSVSSMKLHTGSDDMEHGGVGSDAGKTSLLSSRVCIERSGLRKQRNERSMGETIDYGAYIMKSRLIKR